MRARRISGLLWRLEWAAADPAVDVLLVASHLGLQEQS